VDFTSASIGDFPSILGFLSIKSYDRKADDLSMVVSPGLPLSFTSVDEALLFSIVYFVWVASEIIGGGILPRVRQRRSGAKRKRMDRWSGLAVIIGIFASVIIALTFSQAAIATLPEWTFYLGITLMISGIVLRQWSIALLGRFFSVLVSVQDGQTIIRKGPYRFVRHPSYTGLLLIMTGIGFGVQSWEAVIILILIFGIVFGYRIYIEEKALVAQFGPEYTEYMKSTKMLIPFVL
jgi:protein-S-isoprenylcysteine O-methyltransferase Ste14